MDSQLDINQRHGDKFTLAPGENLIETFIGGYHGGNVSCYLTDKRLVICRYSLAIRLLFGLLAELFICSFNSKRIIKNIPFATINKIVFPKVLFGLGQKCNFYVGGKHACSIFGRNKIFIDFFKKHTDIPIEHFSNK